MKAALLLVDVQEDFLAREGLIPEPSTLVMQCQSLLNLCRAQNLEVIHIHTLVNNKNRQPMPHWRDRKQSICVEGSLGANSPASLTPLEKELVLAKQFYSGFENPDLLACLREKEIDTVIIGGLYTHACVRATALDAYASQFKVVVVTDAIASTEPLHAYITQSFLAKRGIQFLTQQDLKEFLLGVEEDKGAPTWQHRNPVDWTEIIAEVPIYGEDEITSELASLISPNNVWRKKSISDRLNCLRLWKSLILARRDSFVDLIVREVAKPISFAQEEFDYAIRLLGHAISLAESDENLVAVETSFVVKRFPLGLIAVISPWNNPLAIPVGKIAPALAFGNRVAWKPAPQSSGLSKLLFDTLLEAGIVDGVCLLQGDATTGFLLANRKEIEGLSFTGSEIAGQSLALVCAAQKIPFQAELGGNNAVIVTSSCDLRNVANDLAIAIFGFAGQRCTAPRRIIVFKEILTDFQKYLLESISKLKVGNPNDKDVSVGPVISKKHRDYLLDLINAHQNEGRVLCSGEALLDFEEGAWMGPTLIIDPSIDSPLVTEETFGPLAVVLPVDNFSKAVEVANNVRQGLVTTLFSDNKSDQDWFIGHANSGLLVINHAPLRVDPLAPFGGWKASGLGIPEHGEWDKHFYTRVQAIYHSG